MYLYETHMHTCQASACGRSTGKEHVHFYKDAGYTGIIMTDHFFGGNTAVNRELPWDERIKIDNEYVDTFSIGLDIEILKNTVTAVVGSKNIYPESKEQINNDKHENTDSAETNENND